MGSRQEKRLEEICADKKRVEWSTLTAALEYEGFELGSTRGSHFGVTHYLLPNNQPFTVVKPRKGNDFVHPDDVQRALEKIAEVRMRRSEEGQTSE